MDLVGPVINSINHNKYFLTILDDYSRFGWVIFTESKSEIFNKFIIWYNEIYNSRNTTIKVIGSDNGKEFQNSHFQTFCQENGIKHQFTIPYNPSQNGRVERFNGVLISSAKALLNEAKLSHEFWEYAVDTTNFIHNRLPHQGNQNRIPYEVFYNKPVDYSIFRVFGCRVYFFVPKELRSKFDNNSHPGIFLGYSNNANGYKVYDIINNKIILARTVEFLENEPGNSFLNIYFTNNEFRESINIKKLNQYNYYNKSDNKKNKSNEYIFDKSINPNNQKDTNTYKNINQCINKYKDKNNNSYNINHNDNTTIINKKQISTQ